MTGLVRYEPVGAGLAETVTRVVRPSRRSAMPDALLPVTWWVCPDGEITAHFDLHYRRIAPDRERALVGAGGR